MSAPDFEARQGAFADWAAVRAHFGGGQICLSLVRDTGDPDHGTFAKPCKSCTRLLAELGLEVIEP